MIYQYELMRDKERRPYLKVVREIDEDSNKKWSGHDSVMLLNNEFGVREFDSEHAYVIAYDDAFHMVGIYNVSIGDFRGCDMHNRNVGMFLMLAGAKNFCIFHNHPNGELVASNDDRAKVIALQTVGQILGVDFCGSFIIADEGWLEMDKGVHFYTC